MLNKPVLCNYKKAEKAWDLFGLILNKNAQKRNAATRRNAVEKSTDFSLFSPFSATKNPLKGRSM